MLACYQRTGPSGCRKAPKDESVVFAKKDREYSRKEKRVRRRLKRETKKQKESEAQEQRPKIDVALCLCPSVAGHALPAASEDQKKLVRILGGASQSALEPLGGCIRYPISRSYACHMLSVLLAHCWFSTTLVIPNLSSSRLFTTKFISIQGARSDWTSDMKMVGTST